MVAAVESKSKKSKQVPEETIYDSPNEDVEVEEEKEDSKKGAAKAGDGIKKNSSSGTSLRKSSRSKSNLNLPIEIPQTAVAMSASTASVDRSPSASEQPLQSILKKRASTKTSTSKLTRTQVIDINMTK